MSTLIDRYGDALKAVYQAALRAHGDWLAILDQAKGVLRQGGVVHLQAVNAEIWLDIARMTGDLEKGGYELKCESKMREGSGPILFDIEMTAVKKAEA